MAFDTCAKASIASSDLWRQIGKPPLSRAPTIRAYIGAAVSALCQCLVDVVYRRQQKRLALVFFEYTRERGLYGVP